MSLTIADLLVQTRANAGIKRVWGVTGDSLNGINDSLRRDGRIEWMHVRHEEAAAFAAGAEAALTGRLAVCAGSCGPGNLHLINGLFDCQRNHVPVLAIASHIPSSEIGLGYFQETHPQELFRECSVFAELVTNPAQMPEVLHRALNAAVGQQGVAVLVLPGDVSLLPAPAPHTHWAPPRLPRLAPAESDVDELARRLQDAKALTILAGSGCAGAHDELVALASKLKAPIVHTLRGKEFVEWDNPCDVGIRLPRAAQQQRGADAGRRLSLPRLLPEGRRHLSSGPQPAGAGPPRPAGAGAGRRRGRNLARAAAAHL